MVRHDNVHRFGQQQAGIVLDPARLLQLGDLPDKHFGIEDDSITDDAALSLVQNTGRNQVQDNFLVADHQRMPGIVAA